MQATKLVEVLRYAVTAVIYGALGSGAALPVWSQQSEPDSLPKEAISRPSSEVSEISRSLGVLSSGAELAEVLSTPPLKPEKPKLVPDPAALEAEVGAIDVAQLAAQQPSAIINQPSGTAGSSRGAPGYPHATGEQRLAVSDARIEPTQAPPQSAKKVKKKYDVEHIGERGVGGGMNFYSLDREIEMGKELAREIDMQSKFFTDPQVNEYVNRLAQNLVRNSDAKVPFTVKIIDSDELNAFALPGGHFYVNVGMLLAVENEAELAGVMAHEIGHVAARHATKNATKQQIWNLASIPLVFVGGPAGMVVRNVAQLAVPMSFLKFSRNAEREADLLGLEYEYAAGYDPGAMVNFFEKLQSKDKRKPNFVVRAFQSHPMSDDRLKRAQKTIDEMLPEKDEYLITTSEFEEMKARLESMMSKRMVIGTKKDSNAKPKLKVNTKPF